MFYTVIFKKSVNRRKECTYTIFYNYIFAFTGIPFFLIDCCVRSLGFNLKKFH